MCLNFDFFLLKLIYVLGGQSLSPEIAEGFGDDKDNCKNNSAS